MDARIGSKEDDKKEGRGGGMRRSEAEELVELREGARRRRNIGEEEDG